MLCKIGKLMQDHLENQNFDDVTALSPILSRLKDLQRRREAVEREVSEIEAALSHTNGIQTQQRLAELLPHNADEEQVDPGRARPQTLCIRIEWQANKRPHGPEEICEHTAAATMAFFIGRIIQEFGDQAIKKLESIRINRGPLISKTPAKDFINQAQGRLYGNKRIRGTEYYLLTHSSTAQKCDDIKRICRVLGLAPGSVHVEQLDRQNVYL